MPIRLTAVLLLLAGQVFSQDANYWSSSYGPGAFLTPGATIANNGDSGVFFYNPALFAYSRKSSASISGSIYQYQSLSIKNGAGSGLNLNSSGGSVIPQMAANNITLKLKKRPFTIAYALLHEPVIGYTTSQRKDAQLNVLSDSYSPGKETFVGQYTAQNNIDETAGLLCAGMPLSSRLAIGFSVDGRIRKQTYSQTTNSRALFNIPTDTIFPPIASAEQNYLNTYTQIGVRFKAGLAYEISQKDHLGFLVSSPLVRISGSATLVSDDQISNIRQDSLFALNLLASTRQTKLRAKYKMPLSLALGYTHDFATSQFFFSAEYFLRIKEYNIVTPRNEAFIRPDTANNAFAADLNKFRDGRTAILNLAVGFSQVLTPAVTGFITLRTDFNYSPYSVYKDINEGFNSSTSNWDLYHLQLGANLRKRKFNLRLGLLLDYGHTSDYQQPVNYDNPNEENLLQGDPHPTKATRLSAGLMLAYIHNL